MNPRTGAGDDRLTEPPPFGSWRILYVAVIAELAALVVLFYALTRWFS